MSCNCGDLHSFLHDWTPCPDKTQRACHTVQELHLCTLHQDGHVTVQIHLPLLTATLVLQLEPGIVGVVWANIVIAAESNSACIHTERPLGTGKNVEQLSSLRLHTVPNRIVSTTRKHPPPHDIATQTPLQHKGAAESGPSADEEYGVTTIAVATMV